MTVTETFHALFQAACADRDHDAFIALWATHDPTITMWGSELDECALGEEEVSELGRGIVDSSHTLVFEWDELHEHEQDDVAWVNASGALDVDDARMPYRVTAVLVRVGDDDWRWHTFSGSSPH